MILLLLISLLTYPDPRLTPGDLIIGNGTLTICQPGYTTRARHVTPSVRESIWKRDAPNVKKSQRGRYELDHFIPLELGGSNNIKNLWIESRFGQYNAIDKDKLENKLHRLVCSSQMNLDEAQRLIGTDWVAAFEYYVKGNKEWPNTPNQNPMPNPPKGLPPISKVPAKDK